MVDVVATLETLKKDAERYIGFVFQSLRRKYNSKTTSYVNYKDLLDWTHDSLRHFVSAIHTCKLLIHNEEHESRCTHELYDKFFEGLHEELEEGKKVWEELIEKAKKEDSQGCVECYQREEQMLLKIKAKIESFREIDSDFVRECIVSTFNIEHIQPHFLKMLYAFHSTRKPGAGYYYLNQERWHDVINQSREQINLYNYALHVTVLRTVDKDLLKDPEYDHLQRCIGFFETLLPLLIKVRDLLIEQHSVIIRKDDRHMKRLFLAEERVINKILSLRTSHHEAFDGDFHLVRHSLAYFDAYRDEGSIIASKLKNLEADDKYITLCREELDDLTATRVFKVSHNIEKVARHRTIPDDLKKFLEFFNSLSGLIRKLRKNIKEQIKMCDEDGEVTAELAGEQKELLKGYRDMCLEYSADVFNDLEYARI